MTPSRTPVYNLKAVLRETGIKPDVLRAWERRYGLPMPDRTPGGHRLYSQYDIETIKWLIQRQNEGLSISRAVDMWKEMVSQGNEPLERKLQPRETQTAGQSIYLPPETNLESMRSHWIAACLNYNETAAEQTLNEAFSLYPVETVCTEILQRGMAELGMLWYEGRASVQQEHFASGLAMRRLDSLLSAAPAPTRSQTVLVGCPPDEWHTFTPLLLTLFLRRRGINVIYLGANVPANRFTETIAAIQPDMILLAAQQLTSAASLRQTALQLKDNGAKVAFGGRIFVIHPKLAESIPGHFLGPQIDSAMDTIETLLEKTTGSPRTVTPAPEFDETLTVFLAKRRDIESTLSQQVRAFSGSQPEYLETAHRFMGDNIAAALTLGNMDYLSTEFDWLRMMLKSHNEQADLVNAYLIGYAQATRLHMNSNGSLIAGWLENHTKSSKN